jgi:hypothetical protein
MPLSRTQVVDLLTAKSTAVAADIVEPLTNFLGISRQLVQRDAEKLLLMLIIIVRSNLHPDFRALDPVDIVEGRVTRLPTLGVNLRSLADSTGIPKETVRRKVQDLIDAGWVERLDGNLHYTPQAFLAAKPAREALMRMAARIYEVVSHIVEEAEGDAA